MARAVICTERRLSSSERLNTIAATKDIAFSMVATSVTTSLSLVLGWGGPLAEDAVLRTEVPTLVKNPGNGHFRAIAIRERERSIDDLRGEPRLAARQTRQEDQ